VRTEVGPICLVFLVSWWFNIGFGDPRPNRHLNVRTRRTVARSEARGSFLSGHWNMPRSRTRSLATRGAAARGPRARRNAVRVPGHVRLPPPRLISPSLVLDWDVMSNKIKTVEFTGRAGNWVALKGDSYTVIAEAGTLKEAARKARRLRVKNPIFARVPRKDCALIL
jgi:hypothetical protein